MTDMYDPDEPTPDDPPDEEEEESDEVLRGIEVEDNPTGDEEDGD